MPAISPTAPIPSSDAPEIYAWVRCPQALTRSAIEQTTAAVTRIAMTHGSVSSGLANAPVVGRLGAEY
jgi:hypothetical protein